MEILDSPVANSCPNGHENVTAVPKAVSRLDAKAPSPGFNIGQSARNVSLCQVIRDVETITSDETRDLPAEKSARQPALLCKASLTNLTSISPLSAVSVILG